MKAGFNALADQFGRFQASVGLSEVVISVAQRAALITGSRRLQTSGGAGGADRDSESPPPPRAASL